jgi:spore germination protein
MTKSNQPQNPNRKSIEGNVITHRQVTSIIASTLIGVGVLTLPRGASESLREAGWISTILGAVIAMVSIMIIAKLSLKFPRLSLVHYSQQILGSSTKNWVGKVFSFPVILIYAGFFAIANVATARTFGEVVVTSVLRETPLEVIIITMLLAALVLSWHEVEVMARVNEILLPLILLPVLLIALFSFQTARFENMLPIFPVDWKTTALGALAASFAFQGYEVMTLFFGYVKDSSNMIRASLWGIGIPAFVYTMIVLSGILVFGSEELQKLMWPTLELVKTTEVPGLILERLESAFLGVWVAAVFTTVGNLYYALVLMIRQYFRFQMVGQRWTAFLILPLLFWLSLVPQNVIELFKVLRWIGYAGMTVTLGVPLILLIIAMFRKPESPDGNKTREETETHA